MFNKVLITSGPTIEPIDPIRFLSNRSSGKTGYYLARAALELGIAEVVFISGPSAFLPTGVRLINIETTLQLREQVLEHFASSEVVIMAAAVCDYRSVKYYTEKLKKKAPVISLEFVRNPDILRELGQHKSARQILVGFAAETDNPFENAAKKLREKNLDMLVLNEISESNPAFGSDENQVFFVTPSGIEKQELMKKAALATCIWEKVILLSGKKH